MQSWREENAARVLALRNFTPETCMPENPCAAWRISEAKRLARLDGKFNHRLLDDGWEDDLASVLSTL